MIRHCVMFTWADEATDEAKQAVHEGIEQMRAAIPEIVNIAVGADLGLREGNHDFAVTVDFETVDDYRAYAEHPVHLGLIADTIGPSVSGRAGVQFEY